MIYRFAKDAFIYALPMFLARAIGLLLLPIYTREFGPTDFGFIEFVAAASAILLLVLPLEINQAVARFLSESDDSIRQNKILSSALWFTLIVFIFAGIVIYASKFQLLKLANLPESYAEYFGVVCLSFLVSSVINLLQVQFRFTNQAKSSAAINLIVVLINMAFVVYFSTFGQFGIRQFFLSQIISGLAGVIIGLILASREYDQSLLALDLSVLRELLKFSLPIVLSSVGIVVSSTVDKIMVGSHVGLTDLGYYGVAARFAAIVGLGFYVVSTAMTPIVYREYEKPETRKLISMIFNVTVAGLLVMLTVISALSKPIIELIAGNKFSQASNYLFYLMLSTALANLHIFFLGMDIFKNTKLLSKINLYSGALGALGCIIFVPFAGVFGAISSTLLANLIRLYLYVKFSQRVYYTPIAFRWPAIFVFIMLFINLII